MTNRYELTLVLSDDNTAKTADALLDAFMAKSGGRIDVTEHWGKKELAYPIRKQTKAFYAHYVLSMTSAEAVELSKRIRLDEKILRSLMVVEDNKKASVSKIKTLTIGSDVASNKVNKVTKDKKKKTK